MATETVDNDCAGNLGFENDLCRAPDAPRSNLTAAEHERIESLRQALVDREAKLGPDHPDVAQAAFELAISIRWLKPDGAARAEVLLRRAIDIHERSSGPRSLFLFVPLKCLGSVHSQRKEYDEAITAYRRSLAIQDAAEYDIGNDELVVDLGDLCSKRGRFLEAAEYYERALRYTEQTCAGKYKRLAEKLRLLADAYLNLGRYDDAELVYRRELDLHFKEYGKNALAPADLLEKLAVNCSQAGRLDEAIDWFNQACQSHRYYDPDNKSAVVDVRWDMAQAYAEHKRFDEARTIYEQLREYFARHYGPTLSVTVEVIRDLAKLECEQGRLDEAEALLLEGRRLREQTGEQDFGILPSLSYQLGKVHFKQRRFADALADYERAIADHELSHPAGKSAVVSLALCGIAELYAEQGQLDRAVEFYERALAGEEKTNPLSSWVGNLFMELAKLRRREGRLDESAELWTRAMERWRHNFGQHISIVRSLAFVGEIRFVQRRFDETRSLLLEALAMVQELAGDHDGDLLSLLTNLVEVDRAERRWKDAQSRLERAIAIHERLNLPDKLPQARLLNHLVEAHAELQEWDAAESAALRCLALLESSFGRDHIEVAAAMGSLATVYQNTGNLDSALTVARRAREIFERNKPDHPELADYMLHQAAILRNLGQLDQAATLERQARTIQKKALPAKPRI